MNSKKRGRPAAEGTQLSAAAIVEAAKSLMKDEGKVPSIRKLASALNVDAMAIYHYFKNKDAMLEALAVSLIGDIYEPSGKSKWQTELTRLAQSYVELLHYYPGLLETLLSMKTFGPAMVFAERFETILNPLRLKKQSQQDALDLFVDYLHGFALAMSCNKGSEAKLEVNALKGPLKMYIKMLEGIHSAH